MPTIKTNNIYLENTSVKKMYLNGALIFQNFTFTKVTAITLDNLVWVTNIPASGGTATKDNCTYSVTAYYADGTTSDVTSEATITGSQVIPSTNIGEVHSAGTLTLTASYSGFSATGNVTVYQEAAVDFSTKPLTFNILSAGTINWTASNSLLTKTIEYKINNGEWTSITSNTGSSAPTINVVEGDKIQFRGNNAQYANSSYVGLNYNSFGISALFEAEGNIMSLIYGDNFKNKLTINSGYAFYGLFINCVNLVSAENLVLPATTLARNCYQNMFEGCTSLRTAPALPANTLAIYCYDAMFKNCTSLTTAPELPATTLADYCYLAMFENCTSLTIAPALPANTLVDGCYYDMFMGCTSLTIAPELPARTLAEYCYYQMFKDCTSLNYIKCLATNTSARNCTKDWVSGVASTGTFVKAADMTGWTTGVNGIPSGWIVEDNQKPLTFNILSAGIINWTASETNIAKTIEYKLNNGAWVSITSNAGSSAPTITVNSGDKIQFRGNNAQYSTSPSSFSSFNGSTASFELEGNIMSLIYGDDFKNKLSISSTNTFYGLFSDCTNLVSAENLILPATTLADMCYYQMFGGCASLITAPALPATTLAPSCYGNMFYGCSSLETAPSILPAITLAENCYSYMFYGCSSLTTAPELPATTLAERCYEGMFADCSSLNYIKCLATDIYAYGCTDVWVYGVAPTGTFVKNSDMYDWTEDEQGIPAGWDIQDA